ncbi:RNA polymerase sigma factor [Herbaspirillum sp. WGmk3]|uniref:RNA polymerase sigma factor n=2 Tax=Herbaspirillum huttiense TaxID=863372 RepID=A0AAJ2H6J1_9BURK|nr:MULTISPECIES: RNA polymerase sigma factor [Herbaspirillum]MCO4856137.1 RNA polymerase sigma factor [Herbaspirillum sp. WGmk3]MDR9836513.1 RNA polymerase sigma factor [Herbaspirillum huttiense]
MFGRTARLQRQQRERQADEQAMLACLPRLRRYARALTGGRDSADDLVQDTLERAWQKLDSWQRGSDMRPWLFAIMHNLHADQRRQPTLVTVDLEQAADAAAPASVAEHGLALDLEAALQLLPAEQREVLLLVVLEEMRYEEVAATLGIPTGTVMSRLSRARERLRQWMEGPGGQGEAGATLKVVK